MQFHPEVSHTPLGNDILRNFLRAVCGCSGDWKMAAFVESAVAACREKVGDGHVVCGLSGGVDSSVVAMLVHKAIGDRLHCILVDNGLLRRERGGERPQHVPRPLRRGPGRRGRGGALPRQAARRDRPGEEAAHHRPHVHRGLPRAGEENPRRAVPRAGHALPRRDREPLADRRTVGDDQDAPQRRRPAGGTRLRADRAAARTVQGRSAADRPRPRPAGGDGLAAAVPGPGPGGAHRRRSHPRAAGHPAQGGHHRRRGDQARPASIAPSRRASPSCSR